MVVRTVNVISCHGINLLQRNARSAEDIWLKRATSLRVPTNSADMSQIMYTIKKIIDIF